jgi:hypothetical protein
MAELLAVWTAAFFTLAIYSFLYKENAWFRVAEATYLGTAVGYQITVNLKYLRDQWGGVWSSTAFMMTMFAFAMLIGLLWYFRFSKKHFYLYRIPLAILVGTGIGQAMQTIIFAQFLSQIKGQISTPLFVSGELVTSFNNILVAVMVPCTLLYFWFTGYGVNRDTALMKGIDKVARYTMMAGFGSAFGYTVLTRYSLFIGRCQFLLGIAPNPPEAKTAFMVITVVLLATLFGWDLYKRQTPSVVEERL